MMQRVGPGFPATRISTHDVAGLNARDHQLDPVIAVLQRLDVVIDLLNKLVALEAAKIARGHTGQIAIASITWSDIRNFDLPEDVRSVVVINDGPNAVQVLLPNLPGSSLITINAAERHNFTWESPPSGMVRNIGVKQPTSGNTASLRVEFAY